MNNKNLSDMYIYLAGCLGIATDKADKIELDRDYFDLIYKTRLFIKFGMKCQHEFIKSYVDKIIAVKLKHTSHLRFDDEIVKAAITHARIIRAEKRLSDG